MADPGDTGTVIGGYLARPEVDGVAWRAAWSLVEPGDGTYDWSRLDAALSAAAAANKLVTIHIGVSGGAWPAWLTTAGAQTYSGTSILGGTITDPVPWDNVFLARYDRLVQQLASHISARGQTGIVRAVSVGAPVSEMSLVACDTGMLGSGESSVVYSRSNYLSAWKSAADATLAAFPGTPVAISAPVSQICRPDNDGSAFYTDLMTQVPNAVIFAADLNALGSQRYAQVADPLRNRALLFQTIWSKTGDTTDRMAGTLSSAVCTGREAGSRYFEIYKADLDSSDSAIQTAISQARGTAAC
ncbi:beta-galactosidase [Erythrobacter mangrovi]|uniref:Beta-galactosidase n=1 Tax=Erythrobacter mangrovi TaxID=2739433 RepID=A0A7D4CE33_9SPHN|nr:beta-galactosidase [Erythrobacter mangrovi]QKG72209.1 beta-galactosidase [Erythrobacter mangrovi]